jgi:hypothetical protein
MRKSIVNIVGLLIVQGLYATSSLASDKVVEKPVTADTPDKFTQVATQIRGQMATGGRYEFINASDKGKVEADLNSMAMSLQKSGSVAAMSQPEQVQLFNTQEHLNGILTHSDSNRLVCEHRAPVGSNIPLNSCKTVGQIEKMRRDGDKYMDDAGQGGFRCSGFATSKGMGSGNVNVHSNPACSKGN